MTCSGQKLEKVTLSPIKKRNRKKTRTFVELPFVVSQRNQLKMQLAQLLQKGCEDSGINSAGPSCGHINQDTDGGQVKGFPDPSCDSDEPTQMLVDFVKVSTVISYSSHLLRSFLGHCYVTL
jgi:hypothetical protein